ncbi:MAG: L,D-transpeptidase [Actinomycetota bacterium]
MAIAVAGLTALAPGSAVPAQKEAVVSWVGLTPSDGAVLGVAAKTQLSFNLAASSVAPNDTVRIAAAEALPKGAVLGRSDGNPAKAFFKWTPSKSQVGEVKLTFIATSAVPLNSVERTYVVRVGRANKPPPGPTPPPGVYPKRSVLSDQATETYHWAFVRHRTVARSGPARHASAMSLITFRTPEYYRNAIQVLNSVKYRNGPTWVRIRLAILPNGSTGWVTRGSLTGFSTVHTRMMISYGSMRAKLYKRGKLIFSSMVGMGQSRWPTPRGEFYIREKLQRYYAPAYGPRAFGLNAKSAVLTDWSGGGFIGIHGTNQPQILPGRVSHGCVRMRNNSIMRLFRLMPIGTPVHIS